MKKVLMLLGVFIGFTTLVISDLFAAGYNFSYSVEYVRTQSRNATTETADSVYYNPVGLVKLKDGLYVNAGNCMGLKEYKHESRFYGSALGTQFYPRSYKDDTTVPMIPNLGLIYKKDKWALYFAVDIPAGGGELNYEDKVLGIQVVSAAYKSLLFTRTGAADAVISKIYIKNFWIRSTAGASVQITDMISIMGGIRYFKMLDTKKMRSMSPSGAGSYGGRAYVQMATIDTDTTVGGFAGLASLMISPMKELNITALFQTTAVCRGTTKDNLGLSLPRKYAAQDELPSYIALGIAYKVTENLELQLSYDFVFSGEQRLGDSYSLTGSLRTDIGFNAVGGNFLYANKKNQTRVGLGAEYKLGIVKPSLGVSFETPDNRTSISTNLVKPEIKKLVVGAGISILPTDSLNIDLGAAKHFGFSERGFGGIIKISKSITNFGLGVGYKF